MKKLDNQKVVKKRLFEPKEKYLTPVEQEIYSLYIKKGLLPEEISIRRGTTGEAVLKVIRKLKRKGVIDPRNMPLKEPPTQGIRMLYGLDNYYRLHAEHIIAKIIYGSDKYLNALKKGNIVSERGVKLKFHKNCIEIYSCEGLSFIGKTVEEAVEKSLGYWFDYLNWIESKYNLVLVKNGKHNIRIVNSHYAFVNDGMGKMIESLVGRLEIHSEDGKLALITDNSFGNKEIEAIHPEKSQLHMMRLQKHFTDVIENDPPINTELWTMIKKLDKKLETFRHEISFTRSREITIKESNTLTIGKLPIRPNNKSVSFYNNGGRQDKKISVLQYTV